MRRGFLLPFRERIRLRSIGKRPGKMLGVAVLVSSRSGPFRQTPFASCFLLRPSPNVRKLEFSNVAGHNLKDGFSNRPDGLKNRPTCSKGGRDEWNRSIAESFWRIPAA